MEENLRGAADLVMPRDVEAWAVAIRRLEVDREWHRQLATLGMERAVAFRWDHTARSVLDCYEELKGS